MTTVPPTSSGTAWAPARTTCRGQAAAAFGPSNSTATTINDFHTPIVRKLDGVDGDDIYWFALG